MCWSSSDTVLFRNDASSSYHICVWHRFPEAVGPSRSGHTFLCMYIVVHSMPYLYRACTNKAVCVRHKGCQKSIINVCHVNSFTCLHTLQVHGLQKNNQIFKSAADYFELSTIFCPHYVFFLLPYVWNNNKRVAALTVHQATDGGGEIGPRKQAYSPADFIPVGALTSSLARSRLSLGSSGMPRV